MKNTIIGFLAGTLVFLLVGQAKNYKKYEVKTMYSDHGQFKNNWGSADRLELWSSVNSWIFKDESEATLKEMYDKGWKLVSLQKTNASAEKFQFVWVFDREK